MSEQQISLNVNAEKLPPVAEPIIEFKTLSDRNVYHILSGAKPDTVLVEISGYDLQFNFNMEYLKSYEDVTAASEAIGEMFKEIILSKLLEYKNQDS